MTRRSLAVVLFFAFAAVLGAALAYRFFAARAVRGGASDESQRSANSSAVTIPATAPAASAVATAATRKRDELVALSVYFPSRRYVESGDESLPQVVAERFEFDVADAGASADALARALLAALEAGPKSAAATRAIPERLVIRHVQVRDGVAYVDFARASLSGGSLEEALLVRSIVRTLTGVPTSSAYSRFRC